MIECLAKPVANLYRLCCKTGVLTGVHPESDLTKSLSIQCKIPLDKWRTSERLTVRAAQSDPSNLHQCECKRPPVDPTMMIDLTETPTAPKRSMTDKTTTDSGGSQKADTSMVPLADTITTDLSNDSQSRDSPTVWVQNSLYTLHGTYRQLILSPSGWLNDKIVHASQMLLTQHFPDTDGLEPPTLEQIQAFQLHFGEFVQLLNVRNSHWIVVSNLRCDKDVVNVYDTMYPSIPSSTTDTIARLVFCHSATLTIKMVDVDLQSNSSDCGVLSLAIAYDLLCAQAPVSLSMTTA